MHYVIIMYRDDLDDFCGLLSYEKTICNRAIEEFARNANTVNFEAL